MWQTAIVLLILAGVLIYLAGYYLRVYRGKESPCASCSCRDCAPRAQPGNSPFDGTANCDCPAEGERVRQ